MSTHKKEYTKGFSYKEFCTRIEEKTKSTGDRNELANSASQGAPDLFLETIFPLK